MNIQFYFEKLHNSVEFQEFSKEHPDAYLCSGFFVIDKEDKDNRIHFDYFSPKSKKMVSFQLESQGDTPFAKPPRKEKEIKKVPLEIFSEKIPDEVSSDVDLEFNEIEEIILQKMKNEKVNAKIQKMILSLQSLDGKDFIIGTIFIPMLGMIKINLDIKEKKITEFEKKSFFDIMKIMKKGD